MPARNEELARLFEELAQLLELSGDGGFRVRAYERGARALSGYGGDLTALSEPELAVIPGVGKAIAGKVREYLETGRVAKLESLRAELPEGLRVLLTVPGLGPKKARALHERLGIASVDDLTAALDAGAVAGLPGIGAKTAENLRRSLDRLREAPAGVPLGRALPFAEQLRDRLARLQGVVRAELAGSLRRGKAVLGDLDLLAASADPPAVTAAFAAFAEWAEVLGHGDTKVSVLTSEGFQVDLRVVTPEVWGAALQYFTGSKEHNVRVRERAVKAGFKLSEYGLFTRDGDLVVAETEEVVYERLGLAWIPPCLREDRGEVKAASRGELPRLVTLGDLAGDLHLHTDLSGDGTASLAVMVAAARARGFAYLGITDHAEGLPINGASQAQMEAQRAAVRTLEGRLGDIALLHGSELNIGLDGSLDYDLDFLDSFDLLVASIHSYFEAPREVQTARLIAACEHPCVNVIGHPTGRRLGVRPGYDVDLPAVYEAAARTGTALEINGSPERLDLWDEEIRHGAAAGVVFSIDSDSHGPGHLDRLRFGVGMAQRAWLEPASVINTWPLPELRSFLAKDRGARHAGR